MSDQFQSSLSQIETQATGNISSALANIPRYVQSSNWVLDLAFTDVSKLAVLVHGDYDGSSPQLFPLQSLTLTIETDFSQAGTTITDNIAGLKSLTQVAVDIQNEQLIPLKTQIENSRTQLAAQSTQTGNSIGNAKANIEFLNKQIVAAQVYQQSALKDMGKARDTAFAGFLSPGVQGEVDAATDKVNSLQRELSQAQSDYASLRLTDANTVTALDQQGIMESQLDTINTQLNTSLYNLITTTQQLNTTNTAVQAMTTRSDTLYLATTAAQQAVPKQVIVDGILDICLLAVGEKSCATAIQSITAEITSGYGGIVPTTLQEKLSKVNSQIGSAA